MNKITKTISICKWFQKNGINDINKPLTPNNILFNYLLDTWGIFALRNWLSKISLYFNILRVRSYPFTIVCTDSYNKSNNKIFKNGNAFYKYLMSRDYGVEDIAEIKEMYYAITNVRGKELFTRQKGAES